MDFKFEAGGRRCFMISIQANEKLFALYTHAHTPSLCTLMDNKAPNCDK